MTKNIGKENIIIVVAGRRAIKRRYIRIRINVNGRIIRKTIRQVRALPSVIERHAEEIVWFDCGTFKRVGKIDI